MGSGIPPTYVPARNTVLLALAMAWSESLGGRDVVIGVNAVDYSGYPDCRAAFLRAFETLAGLGTKAGVEGESGRFSAGRRFYAARGHSLPAQLQSGKRAELRKVAAGYVHGLGLQNYRRFFARFPLKIPRSTAFAIAW